MRTHRDRVPSGTMVLVVLIVALCAGFHESWALERSWTATTWLKNGQVHMLGDLNGELYFVSGFGLWKTDGTPAGTVPLPGPSPLVSYQPGICPVSFPRFARGGSANGLFFFSATDGTHGQELWKSDGTTAGTQMVKDLDPADSLPQNFVPVDGAIHFSTQVPCCGEWRSDGTDPGTSYLSTQTPPIGTLGGFYLFARDGELWRSDGIDPGPGTTFLADIDPGGTGGATFLAKQAAAKLYFLAAGPTLWVTDGTPAGTLPLLATGGFTPAMICDTLVCYFADNGPTTALWRTDGTVLGTTKLKDVADGNASQPILVNGVAYFRTVHEVWRTDGTEDGTEAIFSDPDVFVSALLTPGGGDIFFVVITTAGPRHSDLWTSDGTPVGTRPVADLGTSMNFPNVVAIDGSLVLGVWGAVLVDSTISTDEWSVQKFDPATEQLITLADAARNVNHCPTPLCGCNLGRPEQLAVVGGKWFFEAVDPDSFAPRLGVASNVYFRDVLPDHWAFPWVEDLADAGLTSGCGTNTYCPDAPVSRAEMAVLLLRGIHGPDHVPPAATGQVFADVPASFWAAAWIEEAAAEGLTSGCGVNPLRYCPDTSVTRAQMAVLLLRAKHGAAYQPPPATGVFADVPTSDPFAPWIEQLALEGITSGCASGPARYCPGQPVTRAQMAVFLVRTFDLTG